MSNTQPGKLISEIADICNTLLIWIPITTQKHYAPEDCLPGCQCHPQKDYSDELIDWYDQQKEDGKMEDDEFIFEECRYSGHGICLGNSHEHKNKHEPFHGANSSPTYWKQHSSGNEHNDRYLYWQMLSKFICYIRQIHIIK